LIDGHDVVRAPLAARRRLGYAPVRPALHLEMTVAGLLDFAAGMKDVGGARARRTAVEDALARAVLGEVAARRIGALSKGVRQRLGLALALVGDPPALLLDEPTAGLDPEQSADMRRLIRALGTERAVLVSSHALAEVEALCDRVVILHRGRVLSADTPARLVARLRPASRIDVEAAAPADALAAALAAVPGVRRPPLVPPTNGHARRAQRPSTARTPRRRGGRARERSRWPTGSGGIGAAQRASSGRTPRRGGGRARERSRWPTGSGGIGSAQGAQRPSTGRAPRRGGGRARERSRWPTGSGGIGSAQGAQRPSTGRAPRRGGGRARERSRWPTGSGGIGSAQGAQRPSTGRAP